MSSGRGMTPAEFSPEWSGRREEIMYRFEALKSYQPNDFMFDPVMVMRRTAKYIHVVNRSGAMWRMKIRKDADGNEYAIDSTKPVKDRSSFTYQAMYVLDDPEDDDTAVRVGTVYEDPEGVFEVLEIEGNDALVKNVQDGNPNYGKEYRAPLHEVEFFATHGHEDW